ncbi:aryl hydrocarbon receptor nuclear translocator homolog [Galendromus occidentalis]|uniref:Aryl hydrocarbon receptor nuclear translocator homolog n=1 Tax=Galendromus occidentalis TaxID=34638 RepID=A0AAJ7L4P4_9ACAR|nr:aryl hydrocarbon receptor nuclear translocator homolog [Galendromus occidentalis]
MVYLLDVAGYKTLVVSDPKSRCAQGVTSDVSKKRKRKFEEKNRRAQLCGKVEQILRLLPSIDSSSKKPTKNDVLRSAANQLRLNLHFRIDEAMGIDDGLFQPKRWRPEFISNASMTQVLEAADGFVLYTDLEGLVLLATPNIRNTLGYDRMDIEGSYIQHILHESDLSKFASIVSEARDYPEDQLRVLNGNVISRTFTIIGKFLEKSAARSEILSYKVMRCHVCLKGSLPNQIFNMKLMKLAVFAQEIDINPSRKFGLTDSIQNEYITYHKLDGTITFADHRIACLTGFSPTEVLMQSAHNFMVEEDRPIALFALAQMLKRNKGTIVYRLRTESGDCIYLRSFGVVSYDSTSLKPEMFMCVNTLLPNDLGEQQRLEFASRYSAKIAISSQESSASLSRGAVGAHDSPDISDDDDFVYGGRSTNPLAIENIVNDDLMLGSKSLIELKPKDHDLDEDPRSPEICDVPTFNGCSLSYKDSRTLSAVSYWNTPGRESSSPESQNPRTSSANDSSPSSSEMGSPHGIHGNLPLPKQWLYPNSGGYGPENQIISIPPYPLRNFAQTSSVHQQTHRHDFSAQIL